MWYLGEHSFHNPKPNFSPRNGNALKVRKIPLHWHLWEKSRLWSARSDLIQWYLLVRFLDTHRCTDTFKTWVNLNEKYIIFRPFQKKTLGHMMGCDPKDLAKISCSLVSVVNHTPKGSFPKFVWLLKQIYENIEQVILVFLDQNNLLNVLINLF